ncbi:nuclease-related domain-containing protein [Nocardia sp. NPDC050710]|uniref:nuclease-related domain-containing protein n=1 Tax=Nocardia sp. NPDC050710 TaxID=3157220 RepID=UPI0033F6867D
MLVINNSPTKVYSEARVARWLRGWTGKHALAGVAIANYHIPDLRTSSTQQADFIILTPQTAVIVEVKGTDSEVTHGVLTAEANGPWHSTASDRDPVLTRDCDTHPVDQALSAAYLFKDLTDKHNPGNAFVSAVVVIVPPHNSTVRLKVGPMPTGCHVVLGNSGLRAWFHKTGRHTRIWSAEQVYSLLNAMNLGGELTIPDLVAEGFPTLDALHRIRYHPHRPSRPHAKQRAHPSNRPRLTTMIRPTSHPETVDQRPTARATHHAHLRAAGARGPSTPRYLRHNATGRRQHRFQQLAAIAVIVAFVAVFCWLVIHFNPTPSSGPVKDQPVPSLVRTVVEPSDKPSSP